ncbi:unnamed protein product [Echinostoma caproni]|uniref:FAD-binding FR-type domain-containing protein n=1 Tax=Echinostoma caproni TaxID=27848 RepID=A0A183B799_9TREM|nr:unnamed protein product [Echinostoma caproni]
MLEMGCKLGDSTDFLPGDVFFVQPANAPDDVDRLLRHTGTNPAQRVLVTAQDSGVPVDRLLASVSRNRPGGISAAWLATYYFDLNAIPTPELFTALILINKQVLEKLNPSNEDQSRLQLEYDRLCELASACWSPEEMDDLNDYVTRPHRRVIETLLDFPVTTSHLSPITWFDVLPGPIRARPYSIASGPPQIELLVAVVSYRTLMSTPRRGLATSYLASLAPEDIIPGWIESQVAGGFDFALPCQTAYTNPCILIAPGTGIAPMRSFLQHLRALYPTEPQGPVRILLFFGCRNSNKDFYFQSEWMKYVAENRIRLICAFSREPTEPARPDRVYVQHRIRENASEVWTCLSQPNCVIYASGNAKSMPTEVREALVAVCQTAGGLSTTDAEALLNQMEAQRRFQIEAWS